MAKKKAQKGLKEGNDRMIVIGLGLEMLGKRMKSAGWHRICNSINLPSGIYFVRVVSGNLAATCKVVLLR